jgi:hypothetical protein
LIGSSVEVDLEQREDGDAYARLEVAEYLQDYDIAETARYRIYNSNFFLNNWR